MPEGRRGRSEKSQKGTVGGKKWVKRGPKCGKSRGKLKKARKPAKQNAAKLAFCYAGDPAIQNGEREDGEINGGDAAGVA